MNADKHLGIMKYIVWMTCFWMQLYRIFLRDNRLGRYGDIVAPLWLSVSVADLWEEKGSISEGLSIIIHNKINSLYFRLCLWKYKCIIYFSFGWKHKLIKITYSYVLFILRVTFKAVYTNERCAGESHNWTLCVL